MKITPEEIIQTQETPLQLFYSGIKSKETEKDYNNKLKKVVCEFFASILKGDPELVRKAKLLPKKPSFNDRRFSDADYEVRVNEFVRRSKADPQWSESLMLKLVDKLRARTELEKTDPDYLRVPSINNYVRPVQKLFDMNSITISWKRIKSTFPSDEDKDDSREYTYDELKKILDHCTEMDKVLVLMAASSGIRAGAFTLKWSHVRPIYSYKDRYCFEDQDVTESVTKESNVVAVLIRAYANSGAEYFAFGTPELWKSILAYRRIWINQTGQEPKLTDPFFKQDGLMLRELRDVGIRRRVLRIVSNAGLRPPLAKGKRRHQVPLFNGFRRFFNKANKKSLSKNSMLASLILKENMMGHNGLIKLDENYFKEHISELIEEYLPSIPNLTISNEERLVAENAKKQYRIDQLEEKNKRIDNLEDKVDGLIDVIEKYATDAGHLEE